MPPIGTDIFISGQVLMTQLMKPCNEEECAGVK